MNYKVWNEWQREMHWDYRWFVWLLLLRPIIDNFYYIKPISPLAVAGILTPIFCIRTIRRYSNANANRFLVYQLWCIILFTSAFALFLQRIGPRAGEILLKVTLPIYLYYFLQRFIYELKDIQGILYTIIMASYIAGGLLIYEVIFNPIQEVEYSRGVQRYRGGYADVMNYGIYMSLGLISTFYFYLKKIKISIFGINNLYIFILLSVLIVTKITHVASYAVFLSNFVLFLLFLFRRNIGIGVLLLFISFIVSVYYGNAFLQEKINPLIEKDMQVLEGEKEDDALLHGRVGRWENYWELFMTTNIFSQTFGTGLELASGNVMGSTLHNDFLRILFTTGWLGLLFYLLSLFSTWEKSLNFLLPERYIALASISTLILYSITTTPTFYANFMYVFVAVIVFFNMPVDVVYWNEYDEE